jgi:hypothetical protein
MFLQLFAHTATVLPKTPVVGSGRIKYQIACDTILPIFFGKISLGMKWRK